MIDPLPAGGDHNVVVVVVAVAVVHVLPCESALRINKIAMALNKYAIYCMCVVYPTHCTFRTCCSIFGLFLVFNFWHKNYGEPALTFEELFYFALEMCLYCNGPGTNDDAFPLCEWRNYVILHRRNTLFFFADDSWGDRQKWIIFHHSTQLRKSFLLGVRCAFAWKKNSERYTHIADGVLKEILLRQHKKFEASSTRDAHEIVFSAFEHIAHTGGVKGVKRPSHNKAASMKWLKRIINMLIFCA